MRLSAINGNSAPENSPRQSQTRRFTRKQPGAANTAPKPRAERHEAHPPQLGSTNFDTRAAMSISLKPAASR